MSRDEVSQLKPARPGGILEAGVGGGSCVLRTLEREVSNVCSATVGTSGSLCTLWELTGRKAHPLHPLARGL